MAAPGPRGTGWRWRFPGPAGPRSRLCPPLPSAPLCRGQALSPPRARRAALTSPELPQPLPPAPQPPKKEEVEAAGGPRIPRPAERRSRPACGAWGRARRGWGLGWEPARPHPPARAAGPGPFGRRALLRAAPNPRQLPAGLCPAAPAAFPAPALGLLASSCISGGAAFSSRKIRMFNHTELPSAGQER